MTLDVVQLGNRFKVIVNVKNADGSARDLTGATGLKIKMKGALASTGKSFDAAFEGLPTAGSIACTLTSTADIDSLSTWRAQAYYVLDGKGYHTRPKEIFYVEGNLA